MAGMGTGATALETRAGCTAGMLRAAPAAGGGGMPGGRRPAAPGVGTGARFPPAGFGLALSCARKAVSYLITALSAPSVTSTWHSLRGAFSFMDFSVIPCGPGWPFCNGMRARVLVLTSTTVGLLAEP